MKWMQLPFNWKVCMVWNVWQLGTVGRPSLATRCLLLRLHLPIYGGGKSLRPLICNTCFNAPQSVGAADWRRLWVFLQLGRCEQVSILRACIWVNCDHHMLLGSLAIILERTNGIVWQSLFLLFYFILCCLSHTRVYGLFSFASLPLIG